jgi:hypothetical protein
MVPDSNRSGRSITMNWWPGISQRNTTCLVLCLCFTSDTEPEVDGNLHTNVSMVHVTVCEKQSKRIFSSTKICLPQQDLRTYNHKHKGLTLELGLTIPVKILICTGILVFLIYETGIPVLIPVFQKQTFFSINCDDNRAQWHKEKTSNYVHASFKSNFYYNNKYSDKNY